MVKLRLRKYYKSIAFVLQKYECKRPRAPFRSLGTGYIGPPKSKLELKFEAETKINELELELDMSWRARKELENE